VRSLLLSLAALNTILVAYLLTAEVSSRLQGRAEVCEQLEGAMVEGVCVLVAEPCAPPAQPAPEGMALTAGED
jgi:hypothetical protein